jgi:hypothetical protein
MLHIELPRALEQYFAYAETEATRRGRRFCITLTYYIDDRLDRIQWWYHVSPAEEQMFDGDAINVFRARATERFRRHIEQWLVNTRQRLHGEDAIPRISPVTAAEQSSAEAVQEPPPPAIEVPAVSFASFAG